MLITKPEWLRHDGDKKKLTAIFSLDFHPDGTRLATGGMDNKIRLWSTQAIRGNSNEEERGTRLLATLTSHSGAVMCVRFSHGSGRYLASGADDMVVLIWERDTHVTAGNLEITGSETWRPVRRLTGHLSDVCDVAWAPGNRFLASCGLDNTVHVWDGVTFERVAKLTGHTQFVKGVTFDPAGKFLATQSDDRTLRVWRTSDWTMQATVSKPFDDNLFSTFFRRPSWSPDGDCVAAANAANGKVPVAAVINRDSWTADLSFVGHRAAIEAVRFNPRVFAQPDNPPACLCAAGGQDRGVSVWLTSQPMPIAAATNLFAGNVMDLAWHTIPDSVVDDSDQVVACLAACSYDGTVALLEFTQAELGRPISASDQEALLSKHGWIKKGDGEEGDEMSDALDTKKPVLIESVEQLRLEERGREILSSENAVDPQPVGVSAPLTFSEPVLTKSGKKRVAPVFVRPLTGQNPVVSATESIPPTTNGSVRVDRVAVDAPIWIEAHVLGTRTLCDDPIESPLIASTVQPLGRQNLIHSQSISAARVHLNVPRIVTHVTCTPTLTHALLTAQNTEGGSKIVCMSKPPGSSVIWTKHTSSAVALLATSSVVAAASCSDGTLHLWDAESGARLMPAIMGEAHLTCLRCVDKFCLALDCVGQLAVWDMDKMCAVVDHISIAPLLYSAELTSETDGAPKRHASSVALTAVDVAPDTGLPIVCLSDGRSFAYHLQLRCWLCIGDPSSYAGSDFGPPLAQNVFTPVSRTRLGYIQETGWHQRNLSSKRAMEPSIVAPEKRRLVTLDHIEHQLGAAAVIGSREDVCRYADVLARHLARTGDVARTVYWANALLGPPTSHLGTWESTMAGVSKRDLLARMLPIMATNRSLQSVVTEYSQALEKCI
ncbi:HIR complex subunit [Coemansia sp. BCRC 34301]|nr:HIR complex subunit [Coemansia sp. BCRC 34301]